INATPVDNDMRVWNALIDGPSDTCYEDGLFTLRMEFTDTYPLTPPNVRFTCKMFHPNDEKTNDTDEGTSFICS
ncbi:unnamed protein product, partial [Rotaria magnacalcarata]